MADFTGLTRSIQVDWLIGKATPAAHAARFITVFNGDPQGAGTEVLNTIAGSATRPQLTSAMGVANTSTGVATSTGDITFTASAVGGATIDHVAVYSAATGGTLMASSPTNASRTVVTGDSVMILTGALTIGIA